MRAHAEIVAVLRRDGSTALARLRGAAPLLPRPTGEGRVHLVGGAAGPLPGDELSLEVVVGPGATLVVGATGATVAHPGPDPEAPASTLAVRIDVAAGASLVWLGEPLIAAAGCRHTTVTEVTLAADARLLLRELLVPGRTAEAPGDAASELWVHRAGLPVLAQRVAVGPASPGWAGAAVLAGARCAGSLVVVGPEVPDRTVVLSEPPLDGPGARCALVPLAAGGAALATALGPAPLVGRLLDRAAALARGRAGTDLGTGDTAG